MKIFNGALLLQKELNENQLTRNDVLCTLSFKKRESHRGTKDP